MKLRDFDGCETLEELMKEARYSHDIHFKEFAWYDIMSPVYLLFDDTGGLISTLLPVTGYLIQGDFIELFSDYTESYYGKANSEKGECFMVIRKEEVDLILYSPANYV